MAKRGPGGSTPPHDETLKEYREKAEMDTASSGPSCDEESEYWETRRPTSQRELQSYPKQPQLSRTPQVQSTLPTQNIPQQRTQPQLYTQKKPRQKYNRKKAQQMYPQQQAPQQHTVPQQQAPQQQMAAQQQWLLQQRQRLAAPQQIPVAGQQQMVPQPHAVPQLSIPQQQYKMPPQQQYSMPQQQMLPQQILPQQQLVPQQLFPQQQMVAQHTTPQQQLLPLLPIPKLQTAPQNIIPQPQAVDQHLIPQQQLAQQHYQMQAVPQSMALQPNIQQEQIKSEQTRYVSQPIPEQEQWLKRPRNPRSEQLQPIPPKPTTPEFDIIEDTFHKISEVELLPNGKDANNKPSYTFRLSGAKNKQFYITLSSHPKPPHNTVFTDSNGQIAFSLIGDVSSTQPIEALAVDGTVLGCVTTDVIKHINIQTGGYQVFSLEKTILGSASSGRPEYILYRVQRANKTRVAIIDITREGQNITIVSVIDKLFPPVSALLLVLLYKIAVITHVVHPLQLDQGRGLVVDSHVWDQLFSSSDYAITKIGRKYWPTAEFYLVFDTRSKNPLFLLVLRHMTTKATLSVLDCTELELLFWAPDINESIRNTVTINDATSTKLGYVDMNQLMGPNENVLMTIDTARGEHWKLNEKVQSPVKMFVQNGPHLSTIGTITGDYQNDFMRIQMSLDPRSKALTLCLAAKLFYLKFTKLRYREVPVIEDENELFAIVNDYKLRAGQTSVSTYMLGPPELVLNNSCPIRSEWKVLADMEDMSLTRVAKSSKENDGVGVLYYLLTNDRHDHAALVLRECRQKPITLEAFVANREAHKARVFYADHLKKKEKYFQVFEGRTNLRIGNYYYADQKAKDSYFTTMIKVQSDDPSKRVEFWEKQIHENEICFAAIEFSKLPNRTNCIKLRFKKNADVRLKAIVITFCIAPPNNLYFQPQEPPQIHGIEEVCKSLLKR